MKGRIRGLDGIRAIAATAVVFCHTVAGNSQIGGYAVNIFFVLSGFLLLNILYHGRLAIERGSIGFGGELTGFWSRRILRICPAYYVVAAVVLAVLVARGQLLPVQTLWFLGYVQNYFIAWSGEWTDFGYSWTLAVEQQFYVVSAAIMLAVPARAHRTVLGWAAVLLFAAMASIIAFDLIDPFVLYRLPLTGFMLASAGGWASLLDGPGPRWWQGLTRGPVVAVSAVLSGLLALAPSAWMGAHPLLDTVQFFFYVPMLTAIVHWVTRHQGAVAVDWLETPLLRFYGAISYSLYLVHGALSHWLKEVWFHLDGVPRAVGFAVERLSLFGVVLAVSTLIAWGLLNGVERPMMRRRRAIPGDGAPVTAKV